MPKNKGYQDVVSSFESTFQDKCILPDGLIRQWFIKALGEYELELSSTGYNEETNEFPAGFEQYKIDLLALMMKRMYCEREFNRVNKIQNIVGKDISLTGSGDQKKMTKDDLDYEYNQSLVKINQIKQSCFS